MSAVFLNKCINMDFKENDARAMNSQDNTLDTTTESSFKEYAATIKSKFLAGELKPTDSRGRSKVWDTFSRLATANGIVTTDAVVCNICKNIYKFERSTSNLVKHKCYIMANSRKRSLPVVDVPSETKKNAPIWQRSGR
uniref:Uncharacterized protein LOC108042491 n=1 Tax=Drosophila rhopaloa TaxID=1041015 RepID=A0A6P4EIC0_DRORH